MEQLITIGFFFLLWFIHKQFEKPKPRKPATRFQVIKKQDPRPTPKIEYIFNGRSIGKPLLLNALEILDITYSPRLSIALVINAYEKQVELALEDQEHGYKVKTTLEDLQAAKSYVLDFGNYVYSHN